MSDFSEVQTGRETLALKRFGYLLSAVSLVVSVISQVNGWKATPFLFLLTMYLVTGSLWMPVLIKPLYRLFGKYIVPANDPGKESDQSHNGK